MKYFKLVDGNPKGTSIWAVREDGYEKCIYDDGNDPYNDVDGDYYDWFDPDAIQEPRMSDIGTSVTGDPVVELSKEEAFLEMI